MSTISFDAPISDSIGNSIAGTLTGMGVPFTMSQTATGYSITAPNQYDSMLSSVFGNSTYIPNMSNSVQSPELAANAPGSPNTDNSNTSGGQSFFGAITNFFTSHGTDFVSIILGLIIVAAAIWKMT